MLAEVFVNYEKLYKNIFDVFYPALNSTGFQERNLTVNFSKAYEKTYSNDNVFSWFELQFTNKKEENVNHFDCVIVNISKKEIIFIEAKRYKSVKKQKARSENDIKRINEYIEKYFYKDNRFVKFRDFKKYGMILADVWQESPGKRKIYEDFDEKVFFKDIFSNSEKTFYKTIRFNCKYENNNEKINPLLDSEQEYDLLAFLWEL